MNREKALKLLKKYNKEEYHVRHGLMVEAIMIILHRIMDMIKISGVLLVNFMMSIMKCIQKNTVLNVLNF